VSVAFPEFSRPAASVQPLRTVRTPRVLLEDCDTPYLPCSRDYSAAFNKLKVQGSEVAG